MGEGISGLQGYFYSGTGCFHRRKVLYGLCPDGCMETGGRNPNWIGGMQMIFFLQLSIFYYIFLLCCVSYV